MPYAYRLTDSLYFLFLLVCFVSFELNAAFSRNPKQAQYRLRLRETRSLGSTLQLLQTTILERKLMPN